MEPLNQNLPIDDRIFVSLLEDSGFKAVMADKANKQLLIGLLNEVLPPHDHIVDIVQYLDREQGLNTVNSKKTVLDLVCLTDDQRTIDIEVQRKMDGYFFQRCFYYAAGYYHRKLSKNEKYKLLKPVYVISFLAEELTFEKENGQKPDKVITRYMMQEETSKIFAPTTIICIFAQLGRFKLKLEECKTRRDLLLYWFKHGDSYESLPLVMKDDPFMEGVVEACRIAAFSKEKYEAYILDMKTELDYEWGLDCAHEDGLKEGLERGREEGEKMKAMETAKNLKTKGIDFSIIAECTGLSIETVGAL